MGGVIVLAVVSFFVVSGALSPDRNFIRYANYIGNNSTAMFLPLFFNTTNYQYRRTVDASSPRRHLKARTTLSSSIPLHDDLIVTGYYSTRVWIGTPPQGFSLIVDTGSTLTYVPCATCEQCGQHEDPKFQPEESSTYQPVKCNIDCNCDAKREQCVYERVYAELSSSSGVLGKDFISFGNKSELKPTQAVFGCENMETGDIYSQRADGIMGLGRGDLSIVDQLVGKGAISDSFSLCYGGMDVGGGAMVLGGISPPTGMVFTRSDPMRSPFYNIDLREIHVAGKKLPLDPKVFDGKHGTVLDSGTTYAYLPKSAFEAFKNAIFIELHSLKKIPGSDPIYNDICFAGAGSNSSQLLQSFPSVEMVFENQQKLLLSPENYVFKHTKVLGAYCLGIFQNGMDPTTLLGGVIVRNTLVTYDREHKQIGFWKTNCSHLQERLPSFSSSSSPPHRHSTAPSPRHSTAPSPHPSTSLPPPISTDKTTTIPAATLQAPGEPSSTKTPANRGMSNSMAKTMILFVVLCVTIIIVEEFQYT